MPQSSDEEKRKKEEREAEEKAKQEAERKERMKQALGRGEARRAADILDADKKRKAKRLSEIMGSMQ